MMPETELELEREQPFPYHTLNFPYHRSLDALVTRRDFLRLLALTSLGLFVGNIIVAIRAITTRPAATPRVAIARVAEVPEGTAINFAYPSPEDPAIMVHLQGAAFAAYSQVCTHLSCAVYYARETNRLECPCHEGYFDPQTGLVIAGPPPRPLPRIALQIEDGVIFATGVTV
ncbi:MAG: Rieske 2Fe-2S domain-containing protein [Chloroflexi bacterium]|nr:Rieske 2Fe-2S domain-containing protein [Chloroflexota bacterium]